MIHRALLSAATALTLLACGDDTGGAAGSGGGTTASSSTTSSTTTTTAGSGGAGGSGATTTGSGASSGSGGEGGAGGAPDLDKDPADVTEADDCYYEGGGGANGWECTALAIDLSASIPASALTFRVETSAGDVFEDVDGEGGPGGYVWPVGDPVTRLRIAYDPGGAESNDHYDPEWIDVEVRRDGALVGAERFEPIEYACVAYSQDDWCWEAPPVTLEITEPATP